MNRSEILQHVEKLVCNERNKTHGDPQLQFATAQTLKAVLANGPSKQPPPQQEALELICTKLARIVHGAPYLDHWLDIAGYAAIGGESVELQAANNTAALGPVGNIGDSGPTGVRPRAPRTPRGKIAVWHPKRGWYIRGAYKPKRTVRKAATKRPARKHARRSKR